MSIVIFWDFVLAVLFSGFGLLDAILVIVEGGILFSRYRTKKMGGVSGVPKRLEVIIITSIVIAFIGASFLAYSDVREELDEATDELHELQKAALLASIRVLPPDVHNIHPGGNNLVAYLQAENVGDTGASDFAFGAVLDVVNAEGELDELRKRSISLTEPADLERHTRTSAVDVTGPVVTQAMFDGFWDNDRPSRYIVVFGLVTFRDLSGQTIPKEFCFMYSGSNTAGNTERANDIYPGGLSETCPVR